MVKKIGLVSDMLRTESLLNLTKTFIYIAKSKETIVSLLVNLLAYYFNSTILMELQIKFKPSVVDTFQIRNTNLKTYDAA